MVAGVADHRVAGLEDRADRAEVRLVAGGEDDRVLGPHPLGQLALELDVQRRRAVQQARAGDPGAVGLERVAGGLLDPLVAGQAEVVVGAEHDRLAALHLDHRAGLGGEQAEVGEEVVLLGRFELLEALVAARLLEDVDGCLGGFAHARECRFRLPMASVSIRPVRSRRDLKRFVKLPFRLHRDQPQWVAPLIFERMGFLDREKNPYFEHAEAEYFLAGRDGEPVGRITAQIDRRWDEYQGGSDAMFGFFESENDPEVAAALLDAADRVGARHGPRPHARPDGLHHQRRERDPDRGLRAPADDPRALAPALLPRADRGRRASARRWTC